MTLSEQIDNAMEQAINLLISTLTVNIQEAATHRTIIIEGWDRNQETRKALAQYLVGLRVSAIDAALRINAFLNDTQEDRIEIVENVESIIGVDNNISIDKKRTERNPWIAEGIWHMCMVIAARRMDIHPNGIIIAVDNAHIITKDHGIDVCAIYKQNDVFGLSLVESKAYKDRPDDAISDAIGFFGDVDNGKHSARIRQAVQIMRKTLPTESQSEISPSFWKSEKTYLPNPHYQYDEENQIDWTRERQAFRNLKPKSKTFNKANIILMPHCIVNFDVFFDQISDEMRTFARGLSNV